MTFKTPQVFMAFIALLLSTNANANANATIIDFSSFVENTAITNQFAGKGVTFRALENGSEVPNVTADFDSPTGDRYLSNCYPTRCDSRADIVEISFSSPADKVSWVLDSEGPESITFNAYDSGGALLETFSDNGYGTTMGFTANGISRIDMLQPYDSWFWGFADLTFELESTQFYAIPVPGGNTVIFGL